MLEKIEELPSYIPNASKPAVPFTATGPERPFTAHFQKGKALQAKYMPAITTNKYNLFRVDPPISNFATTKFSTSMMQTF